MAAVDVVSRKEPPSKPRNNQGAQEEKLPFSGGGLAK